MLPGTRRTRVAGLGVPSAGDPAPVADRPVQVLETAVSPLPIRLHVPGPTPLPDAVREAGARQMVNHRGPEFKALLGRVTAGLQRAFRTQDTVLVLSSSGTGGLEAAVVNHLSPGDPVLAVTIGAFGDRFAKIATTYGADVTRLALEWGKSVV